MAETESPDLTRYHFDMASLAMANIIGERNFDLRENIILDTIRRLSFEEGRLEAYIPSLPHFCRATGISRGNVSTILKRLRYMLVIEERPECYYGFRFPVSDWKVPVRLDEIEVIRQLKLSLGDEVPHLRDAMRCLFVEQCGNKPGSVPGTTYVRSESVPSRLSALENGLPNSGRPQVSVDPSRIGNGQENPITTALAVAVPESGTLGTMKQCKNDHSFIVSLKAEPVPESGSLPPARPPRPRGKKFSVEQQELFDECGRIGAFAADGDPVKSRGCWYSMVLHRPGVVRWLLSEFRNYRVARLVENPGAFMMNIWKEAGEPNRPPL